MRRRRRKLSRAAAPLSAVHDDVIVPWGVIHNGGGDAIDFISHSVGCLTFRPLERRLYATSVEVSPPPLDRQTRVVRVLCGNRLEPVAGVDGGCYGILKIDQIIRQA